MKKDKKKDGAFAAVIDVSRSRYEIVGEKPRRWRGYEHVEGAFDIRGKFIRNKQEDDDGQDMVRGR